jgi:hypothetical protein
MRFVRWTRTKSTLLRRLLTGTRTSTWRTAGAVMPSRRRAAHAVMTLLGPA